MAWPEPKQTQISEHYTLKQVSKSEQSYSSSSLQWGLDIDDNHGRKIWHRSLNTEFLAYLALNITKIS